MSNFAYLQQVPDLAQLHKYCLRAEQYVKTDPDSSANNSRKGLEWIVWAIYQLKKKDTEYLGKALADLLNGEPYLTFISYDRDLIRDADYIRRVGNFGSHIGQDVTEKQAFFAVLNLYNVVGAILQKLGVVTALAPFDKTLIDAKPAFIPSTDVPAPTPAEVAGIEQSAKPDAVNSPAAPVAPASTISEEETRHMFIDLLLAEAGWKVSNTNGAIMPATACVEVEVLGMPTASGKGYADYVLFAADGKPLAVIEAKKTIVSTTVGIQQAKLYADCLKDKYGVRPVIYVSNGLETKIVDDGLGYPPRTLWGFHSQNDLVLLHQRRGRNDMADMKVDSTIAGRPYQQQAIHAVCEWMNQKHRRGLIVMATGTGKTRTSIALVELMIRNGWVKNALFLADRTALVNQAHKNFEKLLLSCSMCELSDKTKDVDYNARITFCTYQTMIKYVDADVKKYSVGHFDLIIIDEAHRSVFGQYRSIIDYFDAMAIGLTATPRDEVDRSTYELFGMDSEPNFAYEYRDAVNDKYLVDYHAVKRGTKILRNGIKYKDLNEDEKKQMEEVFAYESAQGLLDPGAPLAHDIDANKIFKYIYNTDTVDKVLDDLMDSGLKVDSGDKLGKTIIFATNHKHAELIVERFNLRYPQFGPDFCQLIDSQVNYAQTLIDKLSLRDKLPQIAVSVDMLDTGIDVPDILNLVFFKPIHSYIKFWQMIGRGTRLSEDIFGDGKHKEYFMIFDWCENFEFFDMNPQGHTAAESIGLTQRLFNIQTELVYGMQQEAYQQNPVTKKIYDELKAALIGQVKELDDHIINVKKHWTVVSKFRNEDSWQALTLLDVQDLRHEVAPLVNALPDEENAKKWDLIVQQVQLGKVDAAFKATSSTNHMVAVAEALKTKASIPQVMQKMHVLHEVTKPGFADSVGVGDLERVRLELRDLVKFLVGQKMQTFTLNIEDIVEKGGDIAALNPVQTYKQKVLDYLRENRDLPVLQKIYQLEPLSTADVMALEDIFWKELGTREEFDTKLEHNHSIAMFIRSVIGVDRRRALDRFLELIQNSQLTSLQEEYLNSIIGYVCKNGDITPQVILAKNSPFPSPQRAFGPLAIKVKDYIDIIHNSIVPVVGVNYSFEEEGGRMAAQE